MWWLKRVGKHTWHLPWCGCRSELWVPGWLCKLQIRIRPRHWNMWKSSVHSLQQSWPHIPLQQSRRLVWYNSILLWWENGAVEIVLLPWGPWSRHWTWPRTGAESIPAYNLQCRWNSGSLQSYTRHDSGHYAAGQWNQRQPTTDNKEISTGDWRAFCSKLCMLGCCQVGQGSRYR